MIEKENNDSVDNGEDDSERYSASPIAAADAPAINSPEAESNDKIVSAEAEAAPNGGLKAWTQAIGSFFLFFNSWYAPVESSSLIAEDESASYTLD